MNDANCPIMGTPVMGTPTPLVRFLMTYQDAHPKGYLFGDILTRWTDEQLEDTHDYIQWCFPLMVESQAVPGSPVMTPSELYTISNSISIMQRISQMRRRMLMFYANTDNWLKPMDHNHLRISRILGSTYLLAGPRAARFFLERLDGNVGDRPVHIAPMVRKIWQQVIGGE